MNASVSLAGCAPVVATPSVVWQDTYGNDDLWVHDMIQTCDGNFAMTGQRQYFSMQMDAGSEVFLMKVAANGTKLCSWMFDYGWGNMYSGNYIRQLPDGSFVILGSGSSRDSEKTVFFMLKINAKGEKVFEKYYDLPKGMFGYCSGAALASDGGYVMCGDCFSNASRHYVYMMKVDANGNRLWSKMLNNPGGLGAYGGIARSIAAVPGGFVLTGDATNSDWTNSSVFFLKVDTKGNPVMKKAFGTLHPDSTRTDYIGTCIRQTSDCGYIISGATYGTENPLYGNGSAFLLKLDRNGCCSWYKEYTNDTGSFANSVCQTKDGGYVMTGSLDTSVFGSAYACIQKTDVCGNVQWMVDCYDQYATSGGNLIKQLPDKGYIMSGFAVPGSYAEVLMLRLSPEGTKC